MIDNSDGDMFAFFAALATTWQGWLFCMLAAVLLWWIAAGNAEECARTSVCPDGQSARLLDHECVCVGTPRVHQW